MWIRGVVMRMRRRVLAVLAALALVMVAAVSVAAVLYVLGRVLSALLGFCLFIWSITV